MCKLYINLPRYAGDRDKLALVENGIEIWRGAATSPLVTAGYAFSHQVCQDATGQYRSVLVEGNLNHPPVLSLEEMTDRISYDLMARTRPKAIESIIQVLDKGGTARTLETRLVRKFGSGHLTVLLMVGAAHFLESQRRLATAKLKKIVMYS